MKGGVIGGSLLVAGTAVGAGMLALPIVTGAMGFAPSLALYAICWLFMCCTGLLILEICLKMPPGVNLVSMAQKYLGDVGKWGAWALYLFLFYSLSVAYVSGGGGLLATWLGMSQKWTGPLIFAGALAPCVYFGAKIVDRMNWLFMAGLVGSYLLFIAYGSAHVDETMLARREWGSMLSALPIVFTSFSYQGIIPSLVGYLRRDAKKVRLAIICGTALAFAIYLVWEWLILGIVPKEGLEMAKVQGETAVQPLRAVLGDASVVAIGQAFAFFAITTSYLGVTLGLFDFLADGLQWAKKGMQRFHLGLITFIPPLIIALLNPAIFLRALGYAGGIGCALLLGFLPALMAWISRKRDEKGEIFVAGGRFTLCAFICFALFEVILEFIN